MPDLDPRSQQHLSLDQLKKWLGGMLPPDDRSVVESHLENCVECSNLLETLEPDQWLNTAKLKQLDIQFDLTETQVWHTETLSDSEIRHPPGTPQQLNERWHLERLLARGGIGEVWIALDRVLGKQVVVKKLRQETANLPAVQRRFLHEARITAQLSHPGTVPVIELVDAGADSYYVMSLIQGDTFRKSIEKFHTKIKTNNRPINGELFTLLQTWIYVANTIGYAHSQGVLHRDIKSENIIVGNFGQVTVIDWGLAKRINDPNPDRVENRDAPRGIVESAVQTQPGAKIGTPSFMAPEQAAGSDPLDSELIDVYGLAALLYELLTGRPPFTGKNISEVLRAVQFDSVVPPRSIEPRLPIGICDICLKGLAKNPADRYSSAIRFANEVNEWTNQEMALRQSTEARQKLFDLSDDLMLIFDEQPKVLWANSAWLRHLGWHPDKLVGNLPNALVHPDDVPKDKDVLKKLQRGETATGMLRRTQSADGSYRWHSWSATPIRDEGITCAIGRDLSDQMQQKLDYEQILNAAPDAMVVINSDSTIYCINRQVSEMFGYDENELIGQEIEILIPARFRDRHPKLVKSFMQNPLVRPIHAEQGLFALHRDGTEFPVAIRLSPVETSAGLRVISSIRQQ